MSATQWAVLTVAVVVLMAALWRLWATATRLDRLHRQVLASRTTLENQLLQRAAAASALATSGALDPASAVILLDAANRAMRAAPDRVVMDGLEGGYARAVDVAVGQRAPEEIIDRAQAESELSRILRTVLGDGVDRARLGADPRAQDPLAKLDHAWYRVQLARRFHNAHVAEARRLRAGPLPRLLPLAGRAPLPEPVELDDRRPED